MLMYALSFVMPSGAALVNAMFLLAVLSVVAYLLTLVIKGREPFNTVFYGLLVLIAAWWVMTTFTDWRG